MANHQRYSVFAVTLLLVMLGFSQPVDGEESLEKDVIKTSAGDLGITFIGHGSLFFEFNGKVIHIDPFSHLADYAKLPKADVVLITHHHSDHLDVGALDAIRKTNTKIILTEKCADAIKDGIIIMKNGDARTVEEIKVEAVPAYNLIHKHESGQIYHPKGEGNGYVVTFGDKRVYIAGDTENTPEMKALQAIDIAFLPMNLPYTMTPQMAADAVNAFKPKMLYPYHYGETDTSKLLALLADNENIEVRIRKMK
ncbi:MAG: MBL fold metallo-hydrolase [Candidatus Latescibacterota bacterium]